MFLLQNTMLKEERLKDTFREQHAPFNPFIMPLWGEHTLVLFGFKMLGGRKVPQLLMVEIIWEGWGKRKCFQIPEKLISSLEN